ncbi:MAG: hypothetical protein WAZ94_00620 [Phycisphaerales bacterium]
MTQIPTSPQPAGTQGEFSDFGGKQPPAPERTSVMAVLSLILGILSLPCCFLPVVGPAIGLVGLVFAISAMMMIGRSGGALGGKGVAVGGLVTSVLGMLAGVFVLVGVAQALGTLHNYGRFVEIAQSDDRSELEEMLTQDAAEKATKAEMDQFRTKVAAELGEFSRLTPGMMPFFKNFAKFGEIPMTSIPAEYQPGMGQSLLPLPGEFEKGNAVVVVFVSTLDKTNQLPLGRVMNVAVLLPDGTLAWFIDPNRGEPAPTPPAAPEPGSGEPTPG